MKISYKILKKYLPFLEGVEQTSKDLIMHTAEVDEIILQSEHLQDVFIGEIIEISKHSESDKLNICSVSLLGEIKQIVCGASNVKKGIKVPVARVGAKLSSDIIIQKTLIRGEKSEGMICSLDELGLISERQEGIWEMPGDAPLGMNLREYLNQNDVILNIDNKAINHRLDMFSYMGVMRELSTVHQQELGFEYKKIDFSVYPYFSVKNLIPKYVPRYTILKVSGVENISSSDEIQTIIQTSGHGVKGLLIDISNYSLYFYGQPAHIFDADLIEGEINIRFALPGETFEALNDEVYELQENDIVIADSKKILALGGIIGGKNSAVSQSTKNILIETAYFDQAILRKTGKRLGIRTDSLNIFEKDIGPKLAPYGMSLIVDELLKNFPQMKIEGYFDSLDKITETVQIPYDKDFINNLIGANYNETFILQTLKNLGIQKEGNTLLIPFWRKDLVSKADIAEEIARIDGYDHIHPTVPRIHVGAIVQDTIHTFKNDVRSFFTSKGFFDMYNYSFVNQELLEKLNMDIVRCIALKNSLSLEATHMRNSLIPNLLKGCGENIRERQNIKMFEIEKVFTQENGTIQEEYYLSGLIVGEKDIVYYDIQNIVSDFLQTIFVDNFYFDVPNQFPSFAHQGRTSHIIGRGKHIGFVGEIHPVVASRFDIQKRVGFFDIKVSEIIKMVYNTVVANDISSFQENNFDLSFVVDKNIKGKDIVIAIKNTDKILIKKVELFDIYENEEKLPGKRSLSFRIYIQSMTETISDEIKGILIKKIIEKVEKKGGKLR